MMGAAFLVAVGTEERADSLCMLVHAWGLCVMGMRGAPVAVDAEERADSLVYWRAALKNAPPRLFWRLALKSVPPRWDEGARNDGGKGAV